MRDEPLPGLTGLRGVAALAVVAVHFEQIAKPGPLSLGPFDIVALLVNSNTGVALFFVLSGFLLSYPYWQAQSGRRRWPALSTYAVRRMARILPAYWLFLTVMSLSGHIWRESEVRWTWSPITSFFLICRMPHSYTINPPFWTIGIEAQFYVLLPLVMISLRGMPRSAQIGALLVCGIAAYLATLTLARMVVTPGPVVTHSVLAHFPHFLFGVVAANLFAGQARRWSHATSESLFWVTVFGLITILGTGLEALIEIPYGRYDLPLVPALLAVLVFVTPTTRYARWLLDIGPLHWIGILSFGL